MSNRTWFITGCSTGLGRALAQEVLGRGERVVATARDPGSLVDIVATAPERALGLALDVTCAEQIEAAVRASHDAFGKIDVVVNNAGFGIMGTIEQVADADVRRLFDTNFFGALAVLRATLPHLRAQGAGHVVNIASIGGLRGQPGSGIYSSSKFAMIGMSEALAGELAEFGIGVTVVLPGGIRTEFLGRSLTIVPPGVSYERTGVGQRLLSVGRRRGNKTGDARLMARAILDAVTAPTPPLWLVLGGGAFQAAEGKLSALSQELADWRLTSLSVDNG
jgi:NAD(P)-dependent dehydrogenase (short-subunit alcohol dehydrogenase family)